MHPCCPPQLPYPSRSHSYTSCSPFTSRATNGLRLSKNTRLPSPEIHRMIDVSSTGPSVGKKAATPCTSTAGGVPLGLHDTQNRREPSSSYTYTSLSPPFGYPVKLRSELNTSALPFA